MKEQFVVYAEGTWYRYRALFWCREGKPRYNTERNADTFSREEAEKICSMSGKYTWKMYQVG